MPEFKIAIIGEAYGEQEEIYRTPFMGPAGDQLNSILADAGIERKSCYITNVFNLRPDRNNIDSLCCSKAEGRGIRDRSPLLPARFLRTEYAGELSRLLAELERVRPNVAILLGNVACWALLDRQNISKIRGAATTSHYLPWLKCIPTYHPAAVLRQYDLRHVTVLDFVKAKVESAFPEVRRPVREVWLEPTLSDLAQFKKEHIDGAPFLALDIETAMDEITCVGFAPSVERSLVVPFVDARKPSGNYWNSLAEELAAWNFIAEVCASPIPKVGQNGLYDIQWLWQRYGIPVLNYAHDTMLLHHSLFPESPKGLDFLGSVYTNESSWKTERPRGKHSLKKDE